MQFTDTDAVEKYVFEKARFAASATAAFEVIVFPDGKSFPGFRAKVCSIRVDDPDNKGLAIVTVRAENDRFWDCSFSMLGIPPLGK
jgi:hypothetical protein